jgi:glutamate carboxypeptidase
MNELLRFLQEHQEAMAADLGEFVRRETPSTDKRLLDGFAEYLAGYAGDAGGQAEIIPVEKAGNHVRVRWDGEEGRPILLVGHFDTVWPEGTLAEMPFRVERGVAFGPGAFDMKAGLVQGFWAVRALREAGIRRPVVFFCNADEEVGSASSHPHMEVDARAAEAAFVLEPSYDGALKTARKGVGNFHVEITGKASHAGLDPFAGASAIEELARLILELHGLSDRESGTTVNVGVVSGGTRSNVVAAHATAEIDLRVATRAEAERATQRILGMPSHRPEVRVQITGGMGQPPMERTEATVRLFRRAQEVARELGFELGEASVGGGSDGNFISALGVPVLDGLGAVGGGAHATDEHVDLGAMPARAALVAGLLQAL